MNSPPQRLWYLSAAQRTRSELLASLSIVSIDNDQLTAGHLARA